MRITGTHDDGARADLPLTPADLARIRGINREELLARLRSYEEQTRHLGDVPESPPEP